MEKAISNLRSAGCLSLKRISKAGTRQLESYVRPSGFYRQKARRLKIFANHVFSHHGSLDAMFEADTSVLRDELLSIHGIGKETADSISLYAAGKPIFVVDAYTKRIMGRVYGIKDDIPYDKLQKRISSQIPEDVSLYKDFHAQLVELGKNYCKAKPLCNKCPVKAYCAYNAAHSGG